MVSEIITSMQKLLLMLYWEMKNINEIQRYKHLLLNNMCILGEEDCVSKMNAYFSCKYMLFSPI